MNDKCTFPRNSASRPRTCGPSIRWREANIAIRCAVALAFVVATVLHPAHAVNVDGSPDPSWAPRNSNEQGIPGLIEDTYNLGGGGTFNGDMTVNAVTVQPDGHVLTAGFAWNTYNGTDQNACVIRRFLADGDYDPSFGTAGAVVLNFSASGTSSPKLDCYLNSLAVQSDGKIVAAGQFVFGSAGVTPSGIVMRFNADGSTDTSFGDSGGYSHFVLDFTQVLLLGSGQIVVAGTYNQTGFSDTDFYLGVLNSNGLLQYYREAHFDLGGDENDLPTAAVAEHWGFPVAGMYHSFDEIYLTGIADNAAYASGLGRHSCAIAAFRSEDGGLFAADTNFAGSGKMTTEFPVGLNDTDTVCRTATHRPSGTILGATGVVVGGERYFNSASGVGDESMYALADVSADGSVTRHDNFAFFEDTLEPGAFNAIFAMAWDDTGKLLTSGYAGIGANGEQTRAPSDMGLRRFNADYSSDSSFGTFEPGTSILSLDAGGGFLLPSQREWSTALALDPLHARAIIVGERSPWLTAFPNKYYWMLGAVHDGVVQVSDRIFANGFD